MTYSILSFRAVCTKEDSYRYQQLVVNVMNYMVSIRRVYKLDYSVWIIYQYMEFVTVLIVVCRFNVFLCGMLWIAACCSSV